MEKIPERIHTVSIGLDKDRFLRQLLGYLAESLQEVTGMDQAEGFISLVGQKIEWSLPAIPESDNAGSLSNSGSTGRSQTSYRRRLLPDPCG